MDSTWVGCAAVAIACVLAMVLGLEIKINGIAKRLEEKLDSLAQK